MKTCLSIAVFVLAGLASGSGLFAADSPEPDVERLKKDAAAVGRAYAERGKRVAEDAVDFAGEVADEFIDAYEGAKN